MFSEAMRLGVISDTHGLLRPEALAALAGVGHIIHAGDIGSAAILPKLEEIAPVQAIRGNVDTQAWARGLPVTLVCETAGRTIYVIHDCGDLSLDPAAEGFDLVVSGHSHRSKIETKGSVLYLNPGSAGPRRFRLPITLATVDLADNVLRPEVHVLIP